MDKEKKSYHFNVTEVVDGKIEEVMNFNFSGHHDLAEMVTKLEQTGQLREKHCRNLSSVSDSYITFSKNIPTMRHSKSSSRRLRISSMRSGRASVMRDKLGLPGRE